MRELRALLGAAAQDGVASFPLGPPPYHTELDDTGYYTLVAQLLY
jgi:hypothetical protein